MNKILTKFAKILRKQLTNSELKLWQCIRNRQLEGLKFRRQQPIGKFIVDFVCFEKKIIVEVDGGQHSLEINKDKDKLRDEWLNTQGFKVLRFWNNDVLTNIHGVIEVIRYNCLSLPPIKGGEAADGYSIKGGEASVCSYIGKETFLFNGKGNKTYILIAYALIYLANPWIRT